MWLKLVEVLLLVCAGVLFVWWQLRDLRIARDQTRRQKADAAIAREAKQSSAAGELASDGSPRRYAPRDDGSASTRGDGPPDADAAIAREAKQSSAACALASDGSPRRYAPRDDGSASTVRGDGPPDADAVIASEAKQSSITAPSRTDGASHAP